jgi:hypothetical protein
MIPLRRISRVLRQEEAAALFIDYGPKESAIPLDVLISNGATVVLGSDAHVHGDMWGAN